MAKSVLAVRLPEELHTAMKKRAKEEGKTLSEVAVELIEDGLLPQEDKAQAMYERHEDIHKHLEFVLSRLEGTYGELLWKAVVTAGKAKHYARLAAMYTDKIGGPGGKMAKVDQACIEEVKELVNKPASWD